MGRRANAKLDKVTVQLLVVINGVGTDLLENVALIVWLGTDTCDKLRDHNTLGLCEKALSLDSEPKPVLVCLKFFQHKSWVIRE